MNYMASVVGLSGTGKSTAIESVLEALHAEGLSAKSFHDRLGSKKDANLINSCKPIKIPGVQKKS